MRKEEYFCERNGIKNLVSADMSTMPAHKRNSDVGMLAPKPIVFLVLWYFFSGLTLFFNKYIVAVMNGSETVLSKLGISFAIWNSVGIPSIPTFLCHLN